MKNIAKPPEHVTPFHKGLAKKKTQISVKMSSIFYHTALGQKQIQGYLPELERNCDMNVIVWMVRILISVDDPEDPTQEDGNVSDPQHDN